MGTLNRCTLYVPGMSETLGFDCFKMVEIKDTLLYTYFTIPFSIVLAENTTIFQFLQSVHPIIAPTGQSLIHGLSDPLN